LGRKHKVAQLRSFGTARGAVARHKAVWAASILISPLGHWAKHLHMRPIANLAYCLAIAIILEMPFATANDAVCVFQWTVPRCMVITIA